MHDHAQLNLADILVRSCRRTPDKDALVFGDRTWTYAQLTEAVESLAMEFAARGLAHGGRVVVREPTRTCISSRCSPASGSARCTSQ